MGIYSCIDKLSLDELIHKFNQEDPDKTSEGYQNESSLYYEEIAYAIASKGNIGCRYLISQIDRAESVKLPGILAALSLAK